MKNAPSPPSFRARSAALGLGVLTLAAAPALRAQDPPPGPPEPSDSSAESSTEPSPEPATEPAPAAAPAPPRRLALLGGTVHTLVPGEAPRRADVLITDDRIEAVGLVGDGLELPPGTVQVDASGLHLVPGLVDGRVGFDAEHDALYTAHGVTLVRDLGGNPSINLSLRDTSLRNLVPGPDLKTAGALLDGDPPSTPEAAVVRDLPEADRILGLLLGGQPDFLSVHVGLRPEIWRHIVRRGKELDLQVWGPLPQGMELEAALDAGLYGLLTLDSLLPAGIQWDIVLPPAFRKPSELLARRGTALVPLIMGSAYRLVDPGEDPEELRYLGPHYNAWWTGELEFRRGVMEHRKDFLEVGRRVIEKQHQVLLGLHEAGVRLLPGSAAPHPWLLPGRSLHAELAHWQEAGIPPADVLRYATAGAVEVLGDLDERGTLEPGKLADVVAVAGDPTADVRVLERPEMVVVRGRLLERRDLDDLLETVIVVQEAMREDAGRPMTIPAPTMPDGPVVLAGQVETTTRGQRVSGERYAVVREPDGHVTFCGRIRNPGNAVFAGNDVEVQLRTLDRKLVSFRVALLAGEDEFLAEGLWHSDVGRFVVRRTQNGRYIDTQNTQERIGGLSGLGSVTTVLALGQSERAVGQMPVLHLYERLEPEVVGWNVQYDASTTHVVFTHIGRMWFDFEQDGSIRGWTRLVGEHVLETSPVVSTTFGGSGLPLPEFKRTSWQARGAAAEDPGDESGAEEPQGG